MNRERKNEIDKLLSNFFFGCNIPFSVVESSHFKAFANTLNKNYVLPSRKTLSKKLLSVHYEQLCSSIKQNEQQNAVLLIDGWKNSAANSKNVVAMVRLTTGRNLFLESWTFNQIRETGKALSEVVNQCVEIAYNRYNINIYAVVTDNASNMINIKRRVDLWHVTCNSHSGNLLFKSLINTSFDDKVNNIIKDFRSPNLESKLITRGGKKMILSGETRWCSKRNAYRRCLENISIMRDIIKYNEAQNTENKYKFKDGVIKSLFEESFELVLTDYIIVFDPICTLINTCQEINCNIAVATEMWLELQIPTHAEDFEVILQERLTKVINPYGLAANFLHQTYRGSRFVQNQHYINMMNDFFKNNLNENGLQQLEEYKNQTGMFRNISQKRYKSANVFWRTAKPFYKDLSSLAEKLLNIPASTAELERLFSQWTLVHCTKRNRLKPEISAKLIALYYFLSSK